jgi:hypothetical protein
VAHARHQRIHLGKLALEGAGVNRLVEQLERGVAMAEHQLQGGFLISQSPSRISRRVCGGEFQG